MILEFFSALLNLVPRANKCLIIIMPHNKCLHRILSLHHALLFCTLSTHRSSHCGLRLGSNAPLSRGPFPVQRAGETPRL